jgi:ribosomal-protein-alanine N-acetyltransferase
MTTASLEIRRATFADEDALLELIAPLQSAEFSWPRESFLSEFQTAHTWVLEIRQRIEAFVCVRDAGEAWELSVLATRQSEQGKGFMKTLLQRLISQYNHQRQLWLEVHEKNVAAQKLYEKCGFECQGTRLAYYRDGGAALLYTKPKLSREA